MSYAAAFADFGAAAGDLLAVGSQEAEAKTLSQAADLERQNAQVAQESGAIQQQQQQRKAFQIIGGERADIAGSGLAQGGSAEDILRSSQQQSSLASQLIGVQTQINVNSYEAQAGAYSGEAAAANASAKAKGIGGLFSALGGAFNLFA